jgi:hypothetical protein
MALGHAIAWRPAALGHELLSAYVCTGCGAVITPEELENENGEIVLQPCPDPSCLVVWRTTRGHLSLCTLRLGHRGHHRDMKRPIPPPPKR